MLIFITPHILDDVKGIESAVSGKRKKKYKVVGCDETNSIPHSVS